MGFNKQVTWILSAVLIISMVGQVQTFVPEDVDAQVQSAICAKLETNKKIYNKGEIVIFTFTNGCKRTIQLPSPAPWTIEDGQERMVFEFIAPPVTVEIKPGDGMSWQWDQKDSEDHQIVLGTYTVTLKTVEENTDIVNSARFEVAGKGQTNAGVLVKLDVPFPLKVNQTASVELTNMTLKFIIVEDSRCPADVVCVWEGLATILVRVMDVYKDVVADLDLTNTGDLIVKAFGGYYIGMVNIEPYPTTSKRIEPSEYVATLAISKLGEEEEQENGEGITPMLVMITDNRSTAVEVTLDRGIIQGSKVKIDPPQQVEFDLIFRDLETLRILEHVNYIITVVDETGSQLIHESKHVHEGIASHSISFSDTDSFTLAVDIEGIGINKPYDTTYSGTASTTITVTPEFSLGIIAILAAIVAISIAASRLKSSAHHSFTVVAPRGR
ncbi:MAG: hypothetical protein V3T40_05775 [Nitrososphaerales archaeon]